MRSLGSLENSPVEGIYVHIPFCSYKCPYCDFFSLTQAPISPDEYLKLLILEAKLYRTLEFSPEPTLYFGGGTPSKLKPHQIAYLIESLQKVWGLDAFSEITVECNPEDYDFQDFKKLKEAGVNRISLGVQSFTLKGLEILGRKHSVEDSLKALQNAREAGIENVNVDLIIAYPGQSLKDLEKEVENIARLKPPHISSYILTPYPTTPLGKSILSAEVKPPGDDFVADAYAFVCEALKDLGYDHYEVSNWAIKGFECRHNLIYWRLKPFLGLGVSAWGLLKTKRYGNTKNLKAYAFKVKSRSRPVEREEILTEEELLKETLILGFRTKEGVRSEFKVLIPGHLLDFFEEEEGRIRVKERWWVVLNEILACLLEQLPSRRSL